jgi:cell division septum initiation protein DivIVA
MDLSNNRVEPAGARFGAQPSHQTEGADALLGRATDRIAFLEEGWRQAEERARRAEEANDALVKLLTLLQETAESTMRAAQAAADQLWTDAERHAADLVDQARAMAAEAYAQTRSAIEADYSAFEASVGGARPQRSG